MNIVTNDVVKCADAITALEQVIDPELGLNIVDLGLIYQLDFDEPASKIYLQMTLTTQFCPMGESITDAVKKVMNKTFNYEELSLELTFNPAWNSERISAKGKSFLNKH